MAIGTARGINRHGSRYAAGDGHREWQSRLVHWQMPLLERDLRSIRGHRRAG
jgi:hypothetical protein